MPQRPASLQQDSSNTSAHSVVHDTFRPNGLLSSAGPTSHDSAPDPAFPKDAHIPTRHSAEAALKAATNKPLNIAGLTKRKPAPQLGAGQNTRKSFDGSAPIKPFLAPSQAHRLAAPRPSSPFFSGTGSAMSTSVPDVAPSLNVTFLSTGGFRLPILPAPTKLAPSGDDLNSNHAHIPCTGARGASSGPTGTEDVPQEASAGDRYEGLYSLGFNPATRARTASQPSLEKINEADDEEEDAHPGSDDAPQHGLRRSTKRIHEHDHEYDEETFAYGAQAKRYKPDGPSPAVSCASARPAYSLDRICRKSLLRITHAGRPPTFADTPLLRTTAHSQSPARRRACQSVCHWPSPSRWWWSAAKRCTSCLGRS